jgi:hypothetical protein
VTAYIAGMGDLGEWTTVRIDPKYSDRKVDIETRLTLVAHEIAADSPYDDALVFISDGDDPFSQSSSLAQAPGCLEIRNAFDEPAMAVPEY